MRQEVQAPGPAAKRYGRMSGVGVTGGGNGLIVCVTIAGLMVRNTGANHIYFYGVG